MKFKPFNHTFFPDMRAVCTLDSLCIVLVCKLYTYWENVLEKFCQYLRCISAHSYKMHFVGVDPTE